MAAIGKARRIASRSDCAAAALCFRGELVLPNVFDLCANSRTGCRLAASCRCPCTRRNDEDGRVVAYAGKSPAERELSIIASKSEISERPLAKSCAPATAE